MWKHQFFFALLLYICYYQAETSKFDFPKHRIRLTKENREYLDSISTEEWEKIVQYGSNYVERQKSLEENLLDSHITVENGSISHAQLLDSLPNSETKINSDIAMKILRASLHAYDTKCAVRSIEGRHCEPYLALKPLPESTNLSKSCNQILESRPDGQYAFRRLLRHNYNDGFYEMYPETILPAPLSITSQPVYNQIPSNANFDTKERSLSVVQWTQFIEHDLSRPVATSMNDGSPIQCCDKNQYKLPPRFHHPACAPLHAKNEQFENARVYCLNYVRSALAVGQKCNFGGAEQINQATANLDLSQLYGFTEASQRRMRTFLNGRIRSTPARELNQELLPMNAVDPYNFCTSNSDFCFTAGDSRVNSNPFAVVIYTLFMRSHNRIAAKLQTQQPDWDDERLFHTAKEVNVDIYRRIVFDEWMPAILGDTVAGNVNNEPLLDDETIKRQKEKYQISNEFAVAAIRFYYSMMPNALEKRDESNNVLPGTAIFELKDQIYTTNLTYSSRILNEILQSLLHQRAMRMDSDYVDSLTLKNNGRPTHADILALDIQRGRDHGLQWYVRYLQICENVKISVWKDLESYIAEEDLNKLKRLYRNFFDIDLIVGGISEKPANDSVLGPTFTCILAEQLSKIRQLQHALRNKSSESRAILDNYKPITAADFLCANSELKFVPRNIFQLPSEKNQLIKCADRMEALRQKEVL